MAIFNCYVSSPEGRVADKVSDKMPDKKPHGMPDEVSDRMPAHEIECQLKRQREC